MNYVLEKGFSPFIDKINSLENCERDEILKAVDLVKNHSGIEARAALILLDLGLDSDTIIAAMLRLLPESVLETNATQISPAVSMLLRGVKKIDSLKTNSKTVHEAQNIRNMIFALSGDIREIFIKLAEKMQVLHVLDSSVSADDSVRKTAARECLDIYAPLADRLGVSWLKNEMEDLSLKFLNRETFQQIKNIVSEKLVQRTKFLELARNTISAGVEAAGINVEVESRAKHFYSIYMKMRKRNKTAAEIFDLAGIRIICDTVENCYTLLGIVHSLGRPGNGTFRDYIARPKPNGYQSLHTTIMFDEETDQAPDERGKLLEIQIRTRDMHRIAEHGVASHWLYKKGSSREMTLPQEIEIVNKLKDWKQSGRSPGEVPHSWLEELKREILRKFTYVFTPQGKVIKLTAGATPIDFAYHVHTAIGEHCVGAKVNGHIVPLRSHLENTQVVEILTSPQAHPNIGWLESVKSSKIRSKIRSWLEKNGELNSAEKITDTKKKAVPESSAEAPALRSTGTAGTQRGVSLAAVLKVRIGDEKNMMIRFARCCSPAPDDSISGYVSRGRGIIIHRDDCKNLANNPEIENRKINAEWDK